MSYDLRPYQSDLIDRVAADFASGVQRVCAVAPCGAGKTVMVGWMAAKTAMVGRRVLFLVHRRELIDQSDRTFTAMGIRHSIISASTAPDYSAPVQIGSVQTVSRRLDKIGHYDFLITDECHHVTAGTYRSIIGAYPEAAVLGVTATPARLDGNGLGDVFDDLLIGPSVDFLIGRGSLCKYNYYAPPSKADYKSVHIRFGDYVKSELEAAVDDDTLIGDIIDNYNRLAPGRQAVCYCVSRDHSERTAAQFRAAGIPASHVDGETPKGLRDQIINDFRLKKIKILCNVDLLGEGFDVPGMDAVILARPTASLTLFIQQSMRPLRPDPDNPDKVAVIIDHVGNCFRHGLPNMEHDWSLDSKKKKQKPRQMPLHQCAECYQVWEGNSRTCPYCGYAPEISGREVKERAGSLAKIDAVEILEKKRKRQEVGRARSRGDLEKIALQRGYRMGWVKKMMDLKKIRA